MILYTINQYFTQIVGLYEVWGDMSLMIECLSPLNFSFLAMMLFTNSIFNNKEVRHHSITICMYKI